MISLERRQWLVERLRTIANDPLLVPEVAAVFASLADEVAAERDSQSSPSLGLTVGSPAT
jgi:hypothetical protein